MSDENERDNYVMTLANETVPAAIGVVDEDQGARKGREVEANILIGEESETGNLGVFLRIPSEDGKTEQRISVNLQTFLSALMTAVTNSIG